MVYVLHMHHSHTFVSIPGMHACRMMKLLMVACSALLCSSLSQAYRDGARENSCYDHSVIHEGATIVPCTVSTCPYFVLIREVVDDATLELGSETNTYECGRIYGSKLILKVL